MALLYNDSLVKQLKRPWNWAGISRHLFRDSINNFRRRRRPNRAGSHVRFDHVITETLQCIGANFETQASHFQEHGWAYVEDFFTPRIYENVLVGWPSLAFFELKPDLAKSYDRGPNWTLESDRAGMMGIDPCFYNGFQSLLMEGFVKRVADFVGDQQRRQLSSLASAWARGGHHLLPHVDNASKRGKSAVVNFVIFVDGTFPPLASGGTSLFRTNTYKEPLFVPKSLQNTALVYDTSANYFHGFPKVAFRKYSKRIIAQYSTVDDKVLRQSSS